METIHKDILIKLALDLDLPDLLSLCRTSERFNTIVCNSDKFWKQKLWKDYKINSKISKTTYKNIIKNSARCNNLLLTGKVKKDNFVLDSYTDEYFRSNDDYLVYIFLIAKLLNKGEGIPDYFEGLYDRYIEKINPQIHRGEHFSEKDFEEFIKLLKYVKTFGNFENSYIEMMIKGDIPFDVTWENLCNYNIY